MRVWLETSVRDSVANSLTALSLRFEYPLNPTVKFGEVNGTVDRMIDGDDALSEAMTRLVLL